MEEAFRAGARQFGENRVQEFLKKKPVLSPEIRWHLIGQLQTNKVKLLLENVGAGPCARPILEHVHEGNHGGLPLLLHSLDRLALAEEIEKQAQKKNLTVDTLIQVNTTGETTKSGFNPDQVEDAVKEMGKMNRIQIKGLMTVGPTPDVGAGQPRGVAPTNQNQIRSCFRKLRLLRDELKTKFPKVDFQHLSMGMSSDFEIAIEEGATLVRIGTAVFGERSED